MFTNKISLLLLALLGTSQALRPAAPLVEEDSQMTPRSLQGSSIRDFCTSLTGEELIPIGCDVFQKVSTYKLVADGYEIKATIKCKGTAAAVACIGASPQYDGALGVVVGSDDGVLDFGLGEDADSLCASVFFIEGEANVYKNQCKGKGFKIDQIFKINKIH